MNKWNSGSTAGSAKCSSQTAEPQRNARTTHWVELDAGVLSYFEIVAEADNVVARTQQMLGNQCEAISISNVKKSVRALQTNVNRT